MNKNCSITHGTRSGMDAVDHNIQTIQIGSVTHTMKTTNDVRRNKSDVFGDEAIRGRFT